ncbi:hypothetical protein AB0L26_34535, partial [Streptomyces nondiastaticus]|uniref:hypothetical protein n=1 Tax=Streptomyces nondiastaticus TaxID=3154512 RepID=UPI003420728F
VGPAAGEAAHVALDLDDVLAPAASATPQGCYYYVLENKPDADTAIVEDACLLGEPGGQVAFTACYTALRADSVPAAIAAEACRRAPQE